MDHPLCRITSFTIVSPFVLDIRFDDGTRRRIDFQPVLHGEIYGPLREITTFERVEIDPEAHTLVWPNGADFDPATLRDWPDAGPRMAALARRWADAEARSDMTVEAEFRPISGRIAARAGRAGLSLDDRLLQSLAAYVGLLMRWNRRINLTALTADDRGLDRLVVEPLLAAHRLPKPDAVLTDVGSGAGSPAVPMKLAAPAAALRMVESRSRRAAFLREVVRQLRLEGTRVEACRLDEAVRRPDLLAGSDVVTVRAVRLDGRTLRDIQRLVKPGGAVFLFRNHAGVNADLPPGLQQEATWPLLDAPRSHLVILRKQAAD